MQREIKFRGKRLDNGKWIYGDLLTPKSIDDGYWIRYDDEDGDTLTHQVDPATVGQFTGLHDKNGTPIFEGDLIHLPFDEPHVIYEKPYNLKVVFNKGYFGVTQNDLEYEPLFVYSGTCEVISNIHDTPNPSGGSDGAHS